MSKDVQNIIFGIMADILEQIHLIIASGAGINDKTDFNTLVDSDLDHNVKGTIDGDSLNIEFPHYIVYIEWNRPPKYKRKPPYDVILDWLKRKHIQPTAGAIHTVEQFAWVLQTSIWLQGWSGRFIAGLNRDYTGQSPLDNYIDKQWQEKWADELFDAIIKELDKYFD